MNPFAALQVSDDEDTFTQTTGSAQQKLPKKTHQERKQAKDAKIREAQNGPTQTNQDLPEKVKENLRNKRYHEVPLPKEVPATGHYSDKKSGTGRTDKLRKEGGGRGNVGNLKDELNKDRYVAQGVQGNVEETIEPVVEQPQGITLDEYYRNRGVEVQDVPTQKQTVKKGEVNAEWIKKQKLVVLQTKQDKRAVEETGTKKGQKRQFNDRVGLSDNLNSELFGFNTQVNKPREPREEREPREPREHRQPREQREPREPRENRGPRQNNNNRGPRENNNNGNRGPRDNNKGTKPQHAQEKRNVPRKPQEKVVLNQEEFPAL